MLAELAVASVERSRAQTAADAAALAGAGAGPAAARSVARANGAEVRGYRDDGATVEVEAAHRRARGRATAETAASPYPTGGGARRGLAPVTVAALARADVLLGRLVPVRHGSGLAFEVAPSFVDALLSVAADAGLCQRSPETDPIHFAPCPSTSPA